MVGPAQNWDSGVGVGAVPGGPCISPSRGLDPNVGSGVRRAAETRCEPGRVGAFLPHLQCHVAGLCER